jgi:hypothetical protein
MFGLADVLKAAKVILDGLATIPGMAKPVAIGRLIIAVLESLTENQVAMLLEAPAEKQVAMIKAGWAEDVVA